jgi:hypothetical protein
MTMDCFDELLAPIARARFFSESWGKCSTVIAGDRRKFERLPGVADLPLMLAGRLSPERWIPGPLSSAQVGFIDRHARCTTQASRSASVRSIADTRS